MLKATAISHFGTQTALAARLNIKPPAVSAWKEVIPYGRALELERMTDGALSYDESLYPRKDQTAQSEKVA
tara:strand:- start:8 stop:220 length:213 start_codon:yes stop_codon:yes gene_type:complete